ncbi:VIT1/CCC1 transporter family protein [Undibacterium sp. Rencai35W]|uniref:VIT1/CCC1 transporter family protein n=1 Tax=Undibacterium sp. Rencai35W TaxID=3413046 RepID=UPI003BF048BD
MRRQHLERHKLENVNWLRAAVLGANDGIVSASSLLLGVATAHATHHTMLITGIASLVAGAMSMATGEYVSVQSQADTEQAALEKEKVELRDNPSDEQNELANIYMARGLDPSLAAQVAAQLMAHDALGAHTRDELGITDTLSAKPLYAAMASAASFALGALLPLIVILLSAPGYLIIAISSASLLFLAILGGLAAHVGGASIFNGVLRVSFWSALAMGVTAGIGSFIGTTV